MKLRKTDQTKVAIKKDGKPTGKYDKRDTSYHEVSIPDIYIKKAQWAKNDILSCQVVRIQGETVLMLKNISKTSEIMEFKTIA